MHRVSEVILTAVLALSLLGCASNRVKMLESQLSDEQIHSAALQTNVDSLQKNLDLSRSANDSLLAALQEKEATLAQFVQELEATRPTPPEPEATVAPPPAEPTPAVATPLAGTDLKAEYDRALSLFRQKQFGSALDIFRSLLEANFDGNLADNCQYWMGECHFGLRQYDTAIAEFEKVFAFPRSNKIDVAQYKIGLSYVQLKKYTEAREAFNRLIALYPASEYVERARVQLEKLP